MHKANALFTPWIHSLESLSRVPHIQKLLQALMGIKVPIQSIWYLKLNTFALYIVRACNERPTYSANYKQP